MHSLTFRKLVLISDVSASHVSWSFGQNHAAYVSLVHLDRLHGTFLTAGVKHHIAVDLWREQRK